MKKIAVIGAGHNALVCTCYLAKAGHEVAVFERRSRVGGAVNTEELWPGYGVNTCSANYHVPYLIGLRIVPKRVVYGTQKHGAKIVPS